MQARGVDLPPLVEGGDPWCEHYVEFLQEAKTTLPAGWVVDIIGPMGTSGG